jgi:hypothetical protein
MTMTSEAVRVGSLRPLPPEPWGRKMRRARESAGLNMDETIAAMSRYHIVSTASISRLESQDHHQPPNSPPLRRTAYVACLVYGIEPESIGLPVDGMWAVLPAAVADALSEDFGIDASSRCTAIVASQRAYPAA